MPTDWTEVDYIAPNNERELWAYRKENGYGRPMFYCPCRWLADVLKSQQDQIRRLKESK